MYIRNHRKWILVSGDDDGKIYVLRPTTDAANDFTPYEKNILIDTNAQTAGTYIVQCSYHHRINNFCIVLTKKSFTSGKPAIGDLDGDGFTDFIAPGYSSNKLYIFTYAPIL